MNTTPLPSSAATVAAKAGARRLGVRALAQGGTWAFAAWLALPILALVAAALSWDAQSLAILREMAATVLPDYVGTTVALCVGVALAVGLVGSATAVLVTLFDFPGRRSAEWLLLLPLAMPAYVVAYAYTDFLQFSGPLQTTLRELLGWQGRVLPEIRNAWGAGWVFTFTLYPYVYLLARTALAERAPQLLEAARLLGAPLGRRVREVALPLARPAIAAGVALALMETLADFGVVSYFGVQTFTAGIYKAWLVMDDRAAAAQLALMLLATVAALLWVEQRAQRRLRFAGQRAARGGAEARPVRLAGARALAAWTVCVLPVLLGFGLPVLFMLRPLWLGWDELPWRAFGGWVRNSLTLAGTSAVLATLAALALAFAARRVPTGLNRLAVRLVGLGYAVPGAVLVVGLLLPVGWVQARWPHAPVSYWIMGTVLGIVWAYLVRFTAVALQSVHSGYSRVPPSWDDAAVTLGVTGAALWWRLHWPLLRRSVAAALLLVFVDVMKELPATLVLRPFDMDTLAVMAHQMARDERLGEAALPALTLVAVGLIPVMLLSRALRRGETAAC
ncbi:putative 2-aminoethylphosphonate transport system permease protein PhnU [Tepidimonas thermarum]|uniref:Putative 2-aminoethylphosphonate transport system permease protein PhnU n=1 Tax=Tepidimonas thermarum TaxID=335431 RepID=A0A554X0T4_9BURK|nr:iron ABC transporter permease [Tepidimonas thermarum]TSE29356.1 putative 2-aminoethylphosphonate transport system permease protein PhnU [Tepidimonas thermarum]